MQKWGDPKMSDDLISKQEVLNKLNELDQQELYLPCHFKEYVIDEVSNIPQKTGQWIPGQWIPHKAPFPIQSVYSCSKCSSSVPGNIFVVGCDFEFCPYCGARMEEV